MRYKTEGKSLFITLLILYLIFVGLTFFVSFDFETKTLTTTYIFSSIFLFASFAIYFILDRILHYYQVNKKTFLIKKVFSKVEIHYSDIEFIDDRRLKKGVFKLYLKNKAKYNLVIDSKNELVPILKSKCKNLLSLEEFRKKYPND